MIIHSLFYKTTYIGVLTLLIISCSETNRTKQPSIIEHSKNIQTNKSETNNKQIGKHEQSIEILLNLASNAMKKNAFTTPLERNAFQLYQSVLALDPNDETAKKGIIKIREAYIELMDIAVKEGNTKKLFTYYKRAKGVGLPIDFLEQYDLYLSNNINTPKKTLKKSGISKVRLGKSPIEKVNSTIQLRRIGQSYQSQKLFSQAIPIYKHLVKLNSKNSSDWLGLAVSLDSNGQSTSAKVAYQKVIKLKHANKQIIAFSQQRIQELSLSAENR